MDINVDPSIFQFSAKFCHEIDKTKNCASSPPAAAEIITAVMCLKNFDESCSRFSSSMNVSDVCNIPLSFPLACSKLKAINTPKPNYANKVYLSRRQCKLNPSLKKEAKKIFNVRVETIDFSNSSDAAKRINKWVEEKVKKIRGCFHCDSFDVDTNIVLVSRVYFKGIWQMKFDPEDTEESIFYLNNHETVNVFLMCRKEKYQYKNSENLKAQLLVLPFKNEEARMLIVLPKSITGLDRVLQILANGYDLMSEMTQMSQDVEVSVNIPRFKIESEIDLNEVLHKMGIHKPFDRAVQKVLIEVNESGSEPKPERMKCGIIPRWKRKPIEFTADRPHLIVIISHNVPIIWVTFRGRFE